MSIEPPFETIRLEKPNYACLKSAGYTLYDMHLHTRHSDGLSSADDLIKFLISRGINSSITDHNVISGVIAAYKILKEMRSHIGIDEESLPSIIPGIELETNEGPHILMYFYTPDDLSEYYEKVLREKRKLSPAMTKNLCVSDVLELADGYDCVRSAAHPYGYYGINRGVLKCILNGTLPREILTELNATEAICGGMVRSLNLKSMAFAKNSRMAYTAGSDAHILSDVGSVILGTYDTTGVEEHLNQLLKRRSIAVGISDNPIHKGVTAGVIAWSFIPSGGRYVISQCNALSNKYSR